MKVLQIIRAAVLSISILAVIGIVGGVECGEPLSNMWYCLPFIAAAWIVS